MVLGFAICAAFRALGRLQREHCPATLAVVNRLKLPPVIGSGWNHGFGLVPAIALPLGLIVAWVIAAHPLLS